MKWYGVRPSGRLSVPEWAHINKPAAAGLPLGARRTGYIDRLLQQRRMNADSATLSAFVIVSTQSFVLRMLSSPAAERK